MPGPPIPPEVIKKRKQELPAPTAPRNLDFSPEATKHAVWDQMFFSRWTRYSLPLIGLGGLGAFVLEPAFFFFALGTAGLGGLVCLVKALASYNGRDTIVRQHMAAIAREMERCKERMMENLEDELRECAQKVKGAHEYAERALGHIAASKDKLDTLRVVLDQKLSPEELAYGRNLGTAQQVSLAVLDNARQIATLLSSIRSIDPDQLQNQLKGVSESEAETIRERQNLRDKNLKEVARLLADNEVALTELDKATVSIAEMDTQRKEAELDLEAARARLAEIAGRNKKFSAPRNTQSSGGITIG